MNARDMFCDVIWHWIWILKCFVLPPERKKNLGKMEFWISLRLPFFVASSQHSYPLVCIPKYPFPLNNQARKVWCAKFLILTISALQGPRASLAKRIYSFPLFYPSSIVSLHSIVTINSVQQIIITNFMVYRGPYLKNENNIDLVVGRKKWDLLR